MNVGDVLEVRFLNLLPGVRRNERGCEGRVGGGDSTDWPATACAGISVIGLPMPSASVDGPRPPQPQTIPFEFDVGSGTGATGTTSVPVSCETDHTDRPDNEAKRQGLIPQRPGECRIYRFTADRPGAHLMLSHAAPTGGQGDGGSLSHGLFGVVVVEREGSRWYRSQVDAATLAAAREAVRKTSNGQPTAFLNYEAVAQGAPLLNMARSAPSDGLLEIMHSDLNAIVYCPLAERERGGSRPGEKPLAGAPQDRDLPSRDVPEWHCASRAMREASPGVASVEPDGEPWHGLPAHRSFTAVFHDELKTRYARPFELLDPERRLALLGGSRGENGAPEPNGAMLDGIRDGFAINYGASGMGSILLANRLGIGPARDCTECLYEEFFLQSWANGDPALITPEMSDSLPEQVARGARLYPDDPSNVHHSYLGDRVVFQNLHAGPKETHVFHLHAHQWRAGSDGQGAYRDSQTIAPLQAFAYEIDYGGGGNLNLTPGDAIFHCHLYPHFAQGMWALWRNHDVLEDGTRTLPDGKLGEGTNPADGTRRPGAPIPAVVPLPGQAMPPAPTYDEDPEPAVAGRPGYPFFVPGLRGHRAPQPPMDIRDDGGLPRHRVVGVGERHGPDLRGAILDADFVLHLDKLELELLPQDGDLREKRAMAFHAALGESPGTAPRARNAIDGSLVEGRRFRPVAIGQMGAYNLPRPENGEPGWFRVNGRDPVRGAPFADPCRNTASEDPGAGRYSHSPLRVYEVSAVELDLVVNEAGWHDPQGHTNVLTAEAERVEHRSMRAAPFFFRAHSGDCVEYHHQNRTGGVLKLDDFQVATPIDTIGQHIHLVKFDVLAADGSANGWNYEDGTFARSTILERLEAASRGRLVDTDGAPRSRDALRQQIDRLRAEPRYQTTTQRWYADRIWHAPGVSSGGTGGPCTQDGRAFGEVECRDSTLRTVFTHDHFGPSSIQQHGFYSALLVEPEGSEWFTADGRPMCSSPASMAGSRPQGTCVMPVTQLFPPDPDASGGEDLLASIRALWRPNAQAVIVRAGGNPSTQEYHRDHREFPMAIADFALLYAPGPVGVKPRPRTLSPASQERVMEFRRQNGWPVDPPLAPEAISQHHHNPFLLNYGHEPLPLRIGRHSEMPDERPPLPREDNEGDKPLSARCPQTRVNNLDEIKMQRPAPVPRPGEIALADPGDLANAFDSWCHGDPFTEIFEAFEGEQFQIRLIQGAQEVQHVFNAPGLRWRRDPDVSYGAQGTTGDLAARLLAQRNTPADRLTAREIQPSFVSAQEVGISEHFEFQTTHTDVTGRAGAADFLWHFGSSDAIWNGAWGVIRLHGGTIRDHQREWNENNGEREATATPDATCDVARGMADARGLPKPDCDRRAVRGRLLSVRAGRAAAEQAGAADAFRRQKAGEHAFQSPQVHFPEWQQHPEQPGKSRPFRGGIDNNACPEQVAWLRLPSPGTADSAPSWAFERVRMRSYEVVAEPDTRPGERGREVWRGEGGRIYDPRPLRFRAIRMATSLGAVPPHPNAAVYRDLPAADADAGPLVLRALAGECIHVRLRHRAPGAALDPVEGEARLPGIVSLNTTYEHVPGPRSWERGFDARAALGRDALRRAGVLLPSRRVSLMPQLVQQNPLDTGVLAGINSLSQVDPQRDAYRRLAAEAPESGLDTVVDYAWFAGVNIPDPRNRGGEEHQAFTVVGFAMDFGPVPLTSGTDPFFQPAHGLLGTLVVHEAHARLPEPGDPPPPPNMPRGGWTAPVTPVWLARGEGNDRARPADYTDAVLVYRDGLNHHFRSRDQASEYQEGRPLPDCPVCDDSYDRGERGAGWRAEPLWARLMPFPTQRREGVVFPQPRTRPPGPPASMLPHADQQGQPAFEGRPDLNAIVFPRTHLLAPGSRMPVIRATTNRELRLHVLQPAGRARQRIFTVLGHDYRDGHFYPGAPERAQRLSPTFLRVSLGASHGQEPTCGVGNRSGEAGWYGAAGASLLGPGRAVTAVIPCPRTGRWLWRDGPTPMLNAGVWGWLEVRP
ncbi:cupredoxin domain-containing protein [Belnapia rosea]|uniref:Multicopper oxidase n=1 Tax=Belnapia rosea TaxID=938405 RepID=A0A1G6YWD8_9PROT|nr:hypothetical protein [Belnapia rosea]SDD94621.1 hypothetical protein SAMN04487779_101531 [Belnapia rosea]